MARSRFAAGLILALVGVGATACPSNTVDTTSTTAAPATTAPAPTTTQDKKTDEKIARKALLAVEDLPGTGWDDSKKRSSDSSGDFSKSCPEMKATFEQFSAMAADAPKSSSPSMTNTKKQIDVTDDVIVYGTVDDAQTVAKVIGGNDFKECLPRVLEDAIKAGATTPIDITDLTVEKAKVGKIGDDRAVFNVTITVSAGGKSASAHAVAAFIRFDRGYSYVSYTSTSDIDYEADVKPILEKAADKLKKNLT